MEPSSNHCYSVPSEQASKITKRDKDSVEFFEKRKEEIVKEMLSKLKPFINITGQLKPDCDMLSFCNLFSPSTEYVQRSLLLTILLNNSMASPIYSRISHCYELLHQIKSWLVESIKSFDSAIAEKILDLYDRLTLTVAQLVKLGIGKLVKKIITAKAEENFFSSKCVEKAETLCAKWTLLARNEDAQNNDIFLKTKSSNNNNNKNDTDVEEKTQRIKRVREINQNDEDIPNLYKAKVSKKRVSFASENELVSIRYYQPDIHEYDFKNGKKMSDLKFLEKNEASIAFNYSMYCMNISINWYCPKKILHDFVIRADSKELDVIKQRDIRTLYVSYNKDLEIPGSADMKQINLLKYPLPRPLSIPFHDVFKKIPVVARNIERSLKNKNPRNHKDLNHIDAKKSPMLPQFSALSAILDSVQSTNIQPEIISENNSNSFQKKPCKFYRSGKPNSCRFGNNCQFHHKD